MTANPLYTARELGHHLADSRAKLLLTAPPFLDVARQAAAAVRGHVQRIVGVLRRYDWRILEIDALIGLGRLGEAETALAELEISDARGLRTPTSRRTPGCARRGSA